MESDNLLEPVASAADSLRRLAAVPPVARPADLKEPLLWGWHAVAALTYARLSPARERLDAWLWDYLHPGRPELDVSRDAFWEERERLSLLVLLDLLSEESLAVLEPEFYRGWQDRLERCRTLRRQIREVTGLALDEARRQRLLVLLAAYHRLLRLPAAVALDPTPVEARLPELVALCGELVDPALPAGVGAELASALAACRARFGSQTAGG